MPITNFFTANGMILGEQTGNGPQIDYIPDALGSVVAAVDQNLVTTYTAAYSPFGSVLESTGTEPSFTWVGTKGYTGLTGAPYSEYSVRDRFFSCSTGQWAAIDQLWPGQPAYNYAMQSPVRNVDPSGKVCTTGGNFISVSSFLKESAVKIWNPTYIGAGFWDVFAILNVNFYCFQTVTPCWSPGCIPKGCAQIPIQQWFVQAYYLSYPGQLLPDRRVHCGCGNFSACSTSGLGLDTPGINRSHWALGSPRKDCMIQFLPQAISEDRMDKPGTLDSGDLGDFRAWFSTCCGSAYSIHPPAKCQGNLSPLLWGYKGSLRLNTPGKSISICFQQTSGAYPGDYRSPCDNYTVTS